MQENHLKYSYTFKQPTHLETDACSLIYFKKNMHLPPLENSSHCERLRNTLADNEEVISSICGDSDVLKLIVAHYQIYVDLKLSSNNIYSTCLSSRANAIRRNRSPVNHLEFNNGSGCWGYFGLYKSLQTGVGLRERDIKLLGQLSVMLSE